MDRKSRQEIRRYILMFLSLLLCLSAAFFIYADSDENKRRQQITELISLYPEKESDFIWIMEKDRKKYDQKSPEAEEIQNRLENKYGYEYDRCIKENRIWKLYGISILCTGAVFAALWLISGRKKEGLFHAGGAGDRKAPAAFR